MGTSHYFAVATLKTNMISYQCIRFFHVHSRDMQQRQQLFPGQAESL